MESLCPALLKAMNQEHVLLGRFKSAEMEMAEAIRNKDVNQLELCMKTMVELSDSLVKIEEQRHITFFKLRGAVGEDQDASFYQVIVHLPADTRDQLAELYRAIKFAVVGIQAVTSCLDEHVKSVDGTMQQILNELFPHRKGNMYSKEGMPREVESNPLVVNQRL